MNADRLRATPWACVVFAAILLRAAGVATAAPQRLTLAPAGTELTLRAYALGMVPMDGSFGRFQGLIEFDTADPARCSVELLADAASLSFAAHDVTEEVLSPSFLDAAAYPTLSYHGGCVLRTFEGELAMHGETHPFVLALDRDGAHLVATGTINRTEWGVTGRRLTVGASVRIQVSVRLPEAARGMLPGLAGPAR